METPRPATLMDVRSLQHAPPALRKAYVIAVSREGDPEGYSTLTEAHLSLHGRRGSRVSPATLETYRFAIRHFVAWAKTHHRDILNLTRDQAAMYARDMERDGKSASTVAVHLAAVRNLYASLRWSEALLGSPFEDVHHAADPTPAYEKRDPYPDEDLEVLLTHLWTQQHPRLLAFVLLCGHGGLRNREAIDLRWQDVVGDRVKVTGKGGKVRTVVISHHTVRALGLLRALHDGPLQGPILHWRTTAGTRAALRRACAAAGVTYRGAHSLRHTCGTRLWRETRDLLPVSRELGHVDVNTSARYAKHADSPDHPIQNW